MPHDGSYARSGPSGKRLLQPFAWAFTRPGYRRFAEWVTALALNVEEHTITQSVTGHRAARRLEGAGDLRRVRRLAGRLRHPHA